MMIVAFFFTAAGWFNASQPFASIERKSANHLHDRYNTLERKCLELDVGKISFYVTEFFWA